MARRWDRMKREGFLRHLIRELAEDVTMFRASPTGFTALGKARQQMITAHEELSTLVEARAAAKAAEAGVDTDTELAQLCAFIRSGMTHDQVQVLHQACTETLGLSGLHLVPAVGDE